MVLLLITGLNFVSYSFPSFFSDPSSDHVVEDPESFFDVGVGIFPGCLSSVELGERAVLDSIKDMASSSSPVPDGLHASIFKNCSNVLILECII